MSTSDKFRSSRPSIGRTQCGMLQTLILQGQLSISNNKYRYFPLYEYSEKISGNFEEILEENGKILK